MYPHTIPQLRGLRFRGLRLADMSAARVAAIKAELGLPESLVGALPIVGAANLTMGTELDKSATLPTMVQKLEAALGLQPSTAAAATAAPAPAPAAPAAA